MSRVVHSADAFHPQPETFVNPILQPAGDALRIDVISDVVCPWCYVGKRQLEAALDAWRAAHPDAPVPIVRWHPFQLNPDFPPDGMARADYLRRKFGTPDPGAIYERVTAAARAVGLAPDFTRIARQPNTLRAHALIAAAGACGDAQQERMVETLFEAYFLEGADLTSDAMLAALGRRAGLSEAQVAEVLEGDAAAAEAGRADAQARSLGVSGVPLFVIDGRLGVSGAQGAEALCAAFEQARSAAEPAA